MFLRADIVGTRPVASVEATKPIIPAGDAHQELAQRLNRIALGSFLEGQVLSRLQDGAFVVKVADAAVRMNLPAGTQVGQTLDLTLAATEPRPAFILNTAVHENMPSLSSAGRLVDWIIHTAQASGAPTTLNGKTPLAPSPGVAPGQIATSMKDALEFSGLFYESHVEQWVNGERPLAKLIAEPQAKNGNMQLMAAALRAAANNVNAGVSHPDKPHIPLLTATPDAPQEATPSLRDLIIAAFHPEQNPVPAAIIATTPDQSSPQAQAAMPTAPENQAQPAGTAPMPTPNAEELADFEPTAIISVANQTTASPETGLTHKPMSAESVNMVNLQLATLEQQRVTWQGELWPGQQLEWEIGEDTPHGQQTGEQERAWLSTVRFELPTLGKVSATVRLAGERLQIQVRTADEATAALLRTHGGSLSSALAAAGSQLEQLTVKRDEPA